MANQQKGVQQDTAYSAIIVVNDHMYPRPYIVFDPKGHRNITNDIGRDGDTFTTIIAL